MMAAKPLKFQVTFDKNCRENQCNLLKELRDVLPATFGPHPRVGVVVESRSHHMLLDLNSIFLTFLTVIMGHVEPNTENKKTK